jgi:hypothetical protein
MADEGCRTPATLFNRGVIVGSNSLLIEPALNYPRRRYRRQPETLPGANFQIINLQLGRIDLYILMMKLPKSIQPLQLTKKPERGFVPRLQEWSHQCRSVPRISQRIKPRQRGQLQ